MLAVVSLLVCLLLRSGDMSPYLPLLGLIGALILIIVTGLTLLPYVSLRRGPLWRWFATVILVPPAMIFISLSNAPSIVKTLFGRKESFKRTPKSEKAAREVPARD